MSRGASGDDHAPATVMYAARTSPSEVSTAAYALPFTAIERALPEAVADPGGVSATTGGENAAPALGRSDAQSLPSFSQVTSTRPPLVTATCGCDESVSWPRSTRRGGCGR